MMKIFGRLVRSTLLVAISTLSTLVLAQHGPADPPRTDNVVIPSSGTSVSMLDFGGRPVVELMINGKGPYRFIFDTGASTNVVDSSVATEIGGRTDSAHDESQVREVRLGEVTLRNADAAVMPVSKMLGEGDVPRGVLSASSFPGNLVTFDYPAKRIAFRGGTLEEPNGRDIFAYDPHDLPSLPVTVAGREISVHLDTGAPYALALPTKYMKTLPLAGDAVQKGNAKTHAGLLPIFVAPFQEEVSVGQFKLPLHELRFTDVTPFQSSEPRGQIGNEALREFVVTLDSKNHRIRFARRLAPR